MNINSNPDMMAMAKKGEIIVCDKCGHDYFYPIFVLVKVDKLVSGMPKDKIIPLQSFKCAHCGNINREWDPISDN